MGFVASMPFEDTIDETACGRASRRIADQGGDQLQARTKRLTPVGDPLDLNRRGRPPGTARESIERSPVEVTVRHGQAAYVVPVFTEDPVFPYIEWPTRPHVIRPRRDRAPATVVATGRPRRMGDDPQAALTWLGPGGRHFGREVHHPGTRGAHPFALAALELDNTVALHDVAREPLREFEREFVRAAA